MASSSRVDVSRTTRKVVWLAIAIVVVLALYTGGWFYAAERLRSTLSARMTASQTGSVAFACGDLSVRGFPFRIGVFCDSMSVDDHRSGLAASVGALRSAAQVYRPGHAVLEVDGPAQVRMSPDLAFDAEWSLMRASTVVWTEGLDRGSLTYDDLKGKLTLPPVNLSLGIAAQHGEGHVRRAGEALDVAAALTGLVLNPGGRPLPAVDAALDATIADAAGWISGAGLPQDALYGMLVELRALSLDLGNGTSARLSGPVSVSEDGYVSGALDLGIEGVTAWRDRISESFPESAKSVSRIAQVLTAMSGGADRAQVKVTIREGTVYLGLFPIGVIPPL